MSFSFEGYQNFYPNCPVVSGFGTPVVWCRLPNSTTQRCIASGDIKYGEVFVAQGENARYYAMNPFEGRQLQNRIEQFLKVRSQPLEAIAVSHTFFAFSKISINNLRRFSDDRGSDFVVGYGNTVEIWAKIDGSTPILIDTLTYDGEDAIAYGDTEVDLTAIETFGSGLGIDSFGVDDGELNVYRNASFAVWNHQVSPSLAVVYFRFRIAAILSDASELAGEPRRVAVMRGALVYQISDTEGEEGEVVYRDIAFDRPSLRYQIGEVVNAIATRPDSDYRLSLPPSATGNFINSTIDNPLCIPVDYRSIPFEQFSIVEERNPGEDPATAVVKNFSNLASNDVQRPPFAPPVSALQGWQVLTQIGVDEEGNLVFTYQPYYPAYASPERLPAAGEGTNYKVPSLLPEHPNVQYAYSYKAYWDIEDEYPMMILNDEQHQAFEEDENVDPYILPNPTTDVDIDLGLLGVMRAIAPRNTFLLTDEGALLLTGDKEDAHLMYYLLNDDRLFHRYQRESNTDAAFKVEEFSFNITLDDFVELGAPIEELCYMGSEARRIVRSPGGSPYDDVSLETNYDFMLDESLTDPSASRLSLCSGNLSWRNEGGAVEEGVTRLGVDDTVLSVATYYAYTDLAFAPFPTRL